MKIKLGESVLQSVYREKIHYVFLFRPEIMSMEDGYLWTGGFDKQEIIDALCRLEQIKVEELNEYYLSVEENGFNYILKKSQKEVQHGW